jgi:hypothetical protein
LATQLKGKAAEVYTQLSLEQSQDHEILKSALLARYKLHAETYRRQFRFEVKSEKETFTQFATRLRMLLRRWLSLDGKSAGKYDDLEDLFLREQLLNTVEPELELFVRQNAPTNVEAAARLADQFACAMDSVRSRENELERDEQIKPLQILRGKLSPSLFASNHRMYGRSLRVLGTMTSRICTL